MNRSILFKLFFLLILFVGLLTFFPSKKIDNPIVKAEVHEIKVNVKQDKCIQGVCNYSISYNGSVIRLNNHQQRLKDPTYYLYYIKTNDNKFCILKLSLHPRDKEYLNKQYREKSLYALKCFEQKDFFRE